MCAYPLLSSSGFYCSGKHHDQRHWGGSGFCISLTILNHSPLLRDLRAGGWKQALKLRPRGMLPTGLLLTACSTCFLRVSVTTSPRVTPSTVRGRSAYTSHQLRKCPIGQSRGGHFLSEVFSSQVTLTKASQHMSLQRGAEGLGLSSVREPVAESPGALGHLVVFRGDSTPLCTR